MDPTGAFPRSVASALRPLTLLEAIFSLWRQARPGRHPRRPALDKASDHLLADIGLNGPGYERATWERYIHR